MEFLLEGIMSVTWQQILMYLVGIILIWLAIKKEYEPALLLPMGFGAILFFNCKPYQDDSHQIHEYLLPSNRHNSL